jgi:hypothetical protein
MRWRVRSTKQRPHLRFRKPFRLILDDRQRSSTVELLGF